MEEYKILIISGDFIVEAGSDCEKYVLINGKSTWKNDKTSVKYKCYDPYELYGTEWDDCIDFEWQLPVPACVGRSTGQSQLFPALFSYFTPMP